ncbi:hypothetical protein [Hyphomicrobium sp.]|uniref:hypothetical protein n=1 Tax=Hyphomicrobium sp. TaxID=82 RepID=UPI0025C50923|nr:hypothetical protein [Hyphomicrobium sp.]MCC7252216.1 hypothetical protein [Hyphomicrobium sp.]
MTGALQWLEPWYAIDDADVGAGLERQLDVELSPLHVLYGESVRLIARRTDTDDALFALSDGRVAEVHLTWKSSTEEDPRWPATAIFASLDEWARDSMRPLHDELSRLQ